MKSLKQQSATEIIFHLITGLCLVVVVTLTGCGGGEGDIEQEIVYDSWRENRPRPRS